jgi:N,N'-diacetyllegionaminate synthase
MDIEFNKQIKIAQHLISDDSPVFIIAEAGVNHNGNMDVAKRLIEIAAEAKVDAVKFQAFKTENLILQNVQKAPYQQKTTEATESQYDMLKKLEITLEQNLKLMHHCKKNGIIFLTTPFDEGSLDELDPLNLPAYKIASTDLTNLPFLKKVAQKGKPIFLSTGMSYLSEVELALAEIYPWNKDLVLMQCTANYPIRDYEANLNVLNTYKSHFNVLLGYSDHTTGTGAAAYSIPMGARVVEKHFTLDKSQQGPDHRASLTPDELKLFVQQVRTVEYYLGNNIKEPSVDELQTRKSLQKCLVATCNIKEGEPITENMLIAKRTGGIGISPVHYQKILSRPADRNYAKDDIIQMSL